MDVFTTANRIHVHTSQSQPRPVSGSVKKLKQKKFNQPTTTTDIAAVLADGHQSLDNV
jgi:hypothetical protein